MVAFADRDRQLIVFCIDCGTEYVLWVNEQDFLDWNNCFDQDQILSHEGYSGEGYIRDKLFYLTASERELLISGTCGKCWKDMVGSTDDEDEEDED